MNSMAQIQKIGGPYTKQEQEIRKNKVFELHFQQGHSAVQIAKILDINRNTINKDIESWYSEIRKDQSNSNKDWFDKQLQRLEFQRTRLQESLVDGLSYKERLQIEKSITHIDLSIASFVVKIEISKRYKSL
jgi:transposase